MPKIEAASFLTLHYRLSGSDGADIINTFHDKPATLTLGSGELTPAMEQRLLGLEQGARAEFDIPQDEAFGPHNPQMVQWVAKKLLAELGDPHEVYQTGDVVQFPTPDGMASYAGVVRQVEDTRVLFDFNHPLAGQAVKFEVQVIGVL